MPVLEIAEKAFYRKDLTSVIFHESIESINEESFAENNILYVVFYGYDTVIMSNAFKGNELEVIYGYKDSEPQDFSGRQNISFIEIEESGLEGDITYIEEIPEQSIVYGDEANFPSKLEAKLSDDSVISVNVFWHNRDFDPYEEGTKSLLCQKTLDRKSTRLNSSHVAISYAGFCLKKKKNQKVYWKVYWE